MLMNKSVSRVQPPMRVRKRYSRCFATCNNLLELSKSSLPYQEQQCRPPCRRVASPRPQNYRAVRPWRVFMKTVITVSIRCSLVNNFPILKISDIQSALSVLETKYFNSFRFLVFKVFSRIYCTKTEHKMTTQKFIKNQKQFCGTRYLPYSKVHNERTVPILAGCIRPTHAGNGHVSTPALKSDVNIVFLDPDFLNDAKISAIRVYLRHLRQIQDYIIFAWVFRTSWPKMGGGVGGQNGETGGAILTP